MANTTLIVTSSASPILITHVDYKCKSDNQADAIDNSRLK